MTFFCLEHDLVVPPAHHLNQRQLFQWTTIGSLGNDECTAVNDEHCALNHTSHDDFFQLEKVAVDELIKYKTLKKNV